MNEALAIAAKAKICSVKLGAVETARFERRPLSGVKRKSSALSEFSHFDP
jgi:hypothetical protein